MKRILYWFSATGNSRHLACRLADRLDGAEVAWMVDGPRAPGAELESVGFVFPVYWFGMPHYVRQFMKRVDIGKASYVYTVASSGAMPGSVHRQARELLGERGISLNAGWTVRMPLNYIPLCGAPDEDKQSIQFEQAGAKIGEIADSVRSARRNDFEDSTALMRPLLGAIRSFGFPRISSADRRFYSQEHCTACGTCAEVCPVRNIDMSEGRPVWNHHCEQCMACLQWCPVEAIQAGPRTASRRRYHHPEYKASDFFPRPE